MIHRYSRLSRMMAAGAFALFAANNTAAKILFVETFSTGTSPDPAVWSVSQTGTDFAIQEDPAGQSPGDGLLAILGSGDGGSPQWGDQLYTVASFPRGHNLRVSFRMWNKFGTNALTAFHGGFHHLNTGPIYATQEAAVDYTYTDFRWGEAIGGAYPNSIQGGVSLIGINNNFGGNTKNGSLLISLDLDNIRGARLGWFKTDVNAVTNPNDPAAVDTRGQNNQPSGARTTGTAANVYVGFGNLDGNPGSTFIDDIVVENDEVANPGGPTVLFVGNTREYRSTAAHGGYQSPGGDYRLRWLLEQNGYNVEFKDDNEVTLADATGKVAVIISSTVASGAIGTLFTSTPVGVITWEAGLFDDLNLSNVAGGTAASQTEIVIDDPLHPLAAGLSGTITVAANSDAFRHATPTPSATGAIKVGSIVGQPTQTAILAYEAGTQMDNGATAPGRRVGLFLGDFRASETLTTNGRALFLAAVAWAASPPSSVASWSMFE